MLSPTRYFRKQQNKENETPNIADLSPEVRNNISLIYEEDYSRQSERSSELENVQLRKNNVMNKTRIDRSLKPLSSTRDPLRQRLQSQLPFAPFSHGTVLNNDDTQDKKKRKKKKKRRQNNFSSKVSKKEITPAYAFKNAETGHLEITFQPPSCVDIDLVGSKSGDGDKSATGAPALYPIAINGGGIGVYTDPREFAKSGINTMSQNRHETANAPTRSIFSFPWNMGDGTFSGEKMKRIKNYNEHSGSDESSDNDSLDLEAGLNEILQEEKSDDGNGGKMFNQWKTWEKVHNYVVNVNERLSRGRSVVELSESPASSMQHKPISSKRKARLSSVYNDDDFDFAIVLQPKEVYSYWADILDFREEYGYSTLCDGSDELYTYSTPSHGSKKRRRQESHNISSDYKHISIDKEGKRAFLKQSRSLFDKAIANRTPPRSFHKKTTPIQSVARRIRKSLSTKKFTSGKTPPSSSTIRRRWGNTMHMSNPSLMSPPIRHLRKKSPKRKNNRYGGTPHPRVNSVGSSDPVESRSKKKRKKNRNCLEIEDIPNQIVPRGIAARTNGMSEFLWALEKGFVVRRHRPNHDPMFVKLSSSDGGDTIDFKYVIPEDAFTAFKGQRLRYNKDILKGIHDEEENIGSAWSEEHNDERMSFDREQHNASLPEYMIRTSTDMGIKKTLADKATKVLHSGSFKAENIIAVTRASLPDPLSAADEPGTATLRETKNCISRDFQNSLNPDMNEEEQKKLTEQTLLKMPCDIRTFSIVLPSMTMIMSEKTSIKKNTKDWLKKANEDWYRGRTSENAFRFLDLEAATAGEYWMLFRGFLLLQRDAMNHRFAAQRAGGFGSNYNQQELEQKEDIKHKKLIQFQEPEDRSWISKLACKKKSCHIEASELELLKPPPSDFFLGFKSPGTQIWSRLRQAGLETKRIYDLDTKTVMIKVRCPSERLMDVAEVLRLKLKTTDGYFKPFQERIMDQFEEGCFGSESKRRYSSSNPPIFRSSARQNIIDFIINSRIRDSGAGLSGQTALGKCIKMHVPLHMHAQLEELYNFWVFFYKKENWNCDNMTIDTDRDQYKPPSFIERLCVGSFYQPLDSIEQYFGERVAFYFAWLQHSSLHLTYMSFLGLIVFISQMVSGTFDHILRPYFSTILMIWSFLVMVTWRKRQNFLAHRWGTMNYKQEETTRPQFRGEYKKCDITGEQIVHYPSWKRWLKYCISIPITVAFTVVSLMAFLIVHANRDIALARYFSEDDQSSIFAFKWSLSVIGEIEAIGAVSLSKENLRDFKFWYIVGAMPCLLGLSLPLLNFILMQVSRRLNDFENYKTESQYLNALITKVIAFRFVTYFSALYYYAYISTGKDNVTVENSILRVATSLVIYLTVSHWWGIFLGIYVPLLIFRWKLYRKGINLGEELREIESLETECRNEEDVANETKRKSLKMKIANRMILLEQAQSKIWEEIMLPDYNPFFDYILAVIYFAFVTCFSAMLPITPLLVLVNQVISMRLNAYKICRSRRRPLSQKAGGIGVWEHVLHMVTVISILTNCSLMTLTSSQFQVIKDNFGSIGLFVVIVCWEHIMLFIKYLMHSLISPYPASVIDAIKKEEYINNSKRNKERNERRSNCYSSKTILKQYNDEEHLKETETKNSKKYSKMFTDEKENDPPFSPSKTEEFDHSTPVKIIPGSSTATEKKKLRRRKGAHIQSSKKKTRPMMKENSFCPNPLTPKRRSNNSAQKSMIDMNSPFGLYFHEDECDSPIFDKHSLLMEDEDESISGLLSTNNAMQYDESDNNHNNYLPSMSRAKLEMKSVAEERAAQKRIEKRISNIGERRRRKVDRYVN